MGDDENAVEENAASAEEEENAVSAVEAMETQGENETFQIKVMI